MSVSSTLQTVARRSVLGLSVNGFKHVVHRRRYSTAAPQPDTLPLAGIRVLDMTRVLAGVSTIYIYMYFKRL